MDTEKSEVLAEIDLFIENWKGASLPMRDCFVKLYKEALARPGTTLQFAARPGVSYSLRPRHEAQTERELFAIIDVIDDDPEDRWLSVCFYEDMISDPEGRGEVIPGGLAGSDGYCFDMYDNDEEYTAYIIARINEAGASAAA